MNYKILFIKLAASHDIPVVFDGKTYNEAELRRTVVDDYILHQTIHLKNIKTAKHFAGGLHELGHALNENFNYLSRRIHKIGPKINGIVTTHLLKEEFNAWKRGKELSTFWTKPMNDTFLNDIQTYIDAWETYWETPIKPKLSNKLRDLSGPYFKT